MRLDELTDRLDAHFRPGAFDEHDGWSFCFAPGDWEALVGRTPAAFAATCNGLMIDPGPPAPTIGRVYLAVFPQPASLDQILVAERERGCPGAMVLTHHVTDFAARGSGLEPVPAAHFDALRQANIALYVVHAPLDCHPRTSTSGALAEGLGVRRTGTFAPYVGGMAGVIGERAPEAFDDFAARVRELCELPALDPAQIRHRPRGTRPPRGTGGGDCRRRR